MAKAQLRTYLFTPGVAGTGTIIVPGKIDLAQLLVITNTTSNTIIYNFADPSFSGTTVTFTRGNYALFASGPVPAIGNTNVDGYTTITLAVATNTMAITDTLQILYERDFSYVKLDKAGTDAWERTRVAAPQAMIDADFEYGLQPTKWQTYDLIRGYPSIYEIPGSDQNVISVQTDASTGTGGVGESLITVTTANAHGLTVGTPITVKGYLNTVGGFSRAEGAFIINSVPSTTTLTYYAKAQVGSVNGQTLNTLYTVLRKAGYYTGASIGNPTLTYVNNNVSGNTATITITFTNPHGLVSGDTILIAVTSVGSNQNLAQGRFFCETIPNPTTITYTARAPGSISGTIVANVYTGPDAFYLHRPFDGGVQLGTGSPAYGSLAVRMSKKYIRYQSGKAINYNTGALFAPSYDVRSVTASSVFSGATITIITDNTDHGCQPGATINLSGVITTGYNGNYVVQSVVDERTITVTATSNLANITAQLSDPCVIAVTKWYGATVRAGTFDDQNGIYYAFDGQTFYACLRYSTFQLAGTLSITTDGNQITGTNTRWTSQLVSGDKIVIKGMTHIITTVVSDTVAYISPDYRGFGSTTTTATGSNGSPVITVSAYAGLAVGMNVSGTGIATGATISSLTSGITLFASISQATGSTQASGTNGTNTLTFNSVTGVQIGMSITAASGIPAGTYITSVNSISLAVTISNNITNNLNNANVSFGANTLQTTSSVALLVAGNSTVSTTQNGTITAGTTISSIITGTTNYIILGATVAGAPGTVTFTTPYNITLSLNNTGAVSGTVVYTTTYNGVVATKTIEINTPQSQWNIDRCDGSLGPFNPSGYKLDPTKMNMIGINWTWYGAGFIEFMMRGPEGNYIMLHRIRNNNVNVLAYMRSGNQPVRYDVSNEGIYRSYTTVAMGSADTQIACASVVGFPSAGQLWIDGEIVTYTSIVNSFTGTATNTNATGNTITLVLSTPYTPVTNQAIVFSGTTFGGITVGQVYYILAVSGVTTNAVGTTTAATITVSTTAGGSAATFTTASGTMAMQAYAGFLGVTRATSLSQFNAGQTRTFTAGSAAAHNINTGLILIGQTATPIIQHWGSAFIMDGLVDQDRGYIFNYQANNVSISTRRSTAFAIRLSPSVSNAIIGDLGIRDLINRAQLLLNAIEITSGGTSNLNSALVIEGVINPQNFPTNPSNITWNTLQGTAYSGNPLGTGQPSFSQVALGTAINFDSQNTVNINTSGASIGQTVINLSSDPVAAGVQIGDDVFIPSITNAVFGNTKVLSLNTSPAQVTISNGLVSALTNGTTVQFSRYTYAVPGETVFSFVSSPQNRDQLDLSALKELTATPLGGRGTYPNGPDTLFINVYLTQGSPVLANLVLRWGEAQA